MRRFRSVISALALAASPVIAPAVAHAQALIGVQVQIGPPPLPIYEQPPLPGPDYVWAPGYWAWDDDVEDYFWIPGTWVLAPRPGLLWTPAWWGWENGFYVFHSGYWGPHVGFYGGVNYGFGYTGFGFEGGYWSGGHFFYNTAVNRVTNINITNVYQKTVIINNNTRVSFNGGPGGVQARPTPAQFAAANEPHIQPTAMQIQHVQAAHGNRAAFATANHGAPPVAATAAPARFAGPGVVGARGPGGPPARPSVNGPFGRAAGAAPAPAGFGGPPPQNFNRPAQFQERFAEPQPRPAPQRAPEPTYSPSPAAAYRPAPQAYRPTPPPPPRQAPARRPPPQPPQKRADPHEERR